VQFGATGAKSRTLFTFGGTGNGSKSVFKTTTGAWGVSLDGVTAHTGGVCDTAPHSVLLHITTTRVTLWVDGVAVIDQALTATTGATSFRLAYVASSTNAATLRPFGAGVIGDVFVYSSSGTPNVAGMRNYLLGRRTA
jgi:hypothetical protein